MLINNLCIKCKGSECHSSVRFTICRFFLVRFYLFLKKFLKLKKHLDLDLALVYSRVKMSSPFLIISIGNFLHEGRIVLYRNYAICPRDRSAITMGNYNCTKKK